MPCSKVELALTIAAISNKMFAIYFVKAYEQGSDPMSKYSAHKYDADYCGKQICYGEGQPYQPGILYSIFGEQGEDPH